MSIVKKVIKIFNVNKSSSFKTSSHKKTSKLFQLETAFFLYINPLKWIAIFQALCDQIPNSSQILWTTLKTMAINAILPILLLRFSLLHLPCSLPIGGYATSEILPSTSCSSIEDPGGLQSSQVQSNPINVISLLSILSPYTVATVKELIITSPFINRIRMWKKLRIEPDMQAMQCLEDGIANGDIVHTKHFDVYFPRSSNNIFQNTKSKQHGLILLPGAFVNHIAYSEIAKKLTENGFTVVVLSMEPYRLSVKGLGADLRDVKRAIHFAESELSSRISFGNDKKKYDNNSIVWEWSIGGHSLGGYAAMRLSSKLGKYLMKQKNSLQDTLKVVIWAAGNVLSFLTDLSEEQNMDMLILLGSNDPLCNFSPRTANGISQSLFESKLPPKHNLIIIEGGTHNNFASYSGSVAMNGVEGISRIQQHQFVINATSKFLLHKNNL